MIVSRTPEARPSQLSRWWLAALIATASVLVGAIQLAHFDRSAAPPHRVSAPASAVPSEPVVPFASAAPSTSVAPPASPPSASPAYGTLLRMPGSVPTHGTGKFAYAEGRGPVLGKSGRVKQFRVAVERGSGEDVAGFAAEVEHTLGDPRSWVGDGAFRLRRVSGSDPADFTVYLATRQTASQICEAGGTNIWSRPGFYTSCRTRGKAVINLERWRLSAPTYIEAKVPLSVYREYVINHEVGHEFGHHHEGCPKRGGPAPVMVQQSLDLRGCTPYAWPHRNGQRLAGPQL